MPSRLPATPARAEDDDGGGWWGSRYESWYNEGSLDTIARSTADRAYWRNGYTGGGIDVAVIDTGVAPVAGLGAPGKVINGPDLSFESQADNLRYLDTNGHGTHLDSIIAGKDDGVGNPMYTTSDQFVGMAPMPASSMSRSATPWAPSTSPR